jgi:lambda family phage portal protein
VGLLSRMFGGSKRAQAVAPPVSVRARFDAAESTDDHRHWANADWLSMDGALTPLKRARMRNRARYERLNNSYLAGIADTLAIDLVGTGPRLQLTTGNPDADREVEKRFFDDMWRIDLPGKLRTMRQAKLIDGEAFAQLFTNPALDGVQLDVRLIEAEMVATPVNMREDVTPEGSAVDGLEFDAAGNVVAYRVLRYHPGSNWYTTAVDYSRVEARNMIHWFSRIRPQQHRGVSEVGPSLRLFANLRRYTEATIAAAETAADLAAFIHSNSPAAEVDEVTPFESMDIEKRSLVTLPEGWSVSQLKAEQPTNTYSAFKREIVGEIGRSVNLPFNMAALDSSSYNYASGRMDSTIHIANTRVLRDELERICLDRVLLAWLDEAVLIPGLVPTGLPPINEWQWAWVWDGREHVDPAKEATATEIRLRTNTTTLAAEYAKAGKNWEAELRQRAAELALQRQLGLPTDLPQPAPAMQPQGDASNQ